MSKEMNYLYIAACPDAIAQVWHLSTEELVFPSWISNVQHCGLLGWPIGRIYIGYQFWRFSGRFLSYCFANLMVFLRVAAQGSKCPQQHRQLLSDSRGKQPVLPTHFHIQLGEIKVYLEGLLLRKTRESEASSSRETVGKTSIYSRHNFSSYSVN